MLFVSNMRKPQLLTLGVTVGAAVVAAVFAGCGAEGASGSGASPGGDGNVGLGGAQDIGQFRGYLDRNEIPTAASLDANGFFSEHYIARDGRVRQCDLRNRANQQPAGLV